MKKYGKADKQNVVVLLEGGDRRELVRFALMALGDEFKKRITKAKKIFIHPNIVSPRNPDSCTNVETVRGVVDHISLIRTDKIPIGDASYHDTKAGFKLLDYTSLSRSGNVELIDLNDDEIIEGFAYTADLKKRPIGFSKTVAESDFNIVVVPAKMHSYYITTLSLKTHIIGSQVVRSSPFGIHGRWQWNHTGYKPAHMTLAENYMIHPAQLAIIDGVWTMEGNGPTSGNMVETRWLIASFNPVAADALASYLMGLDPKDIGSLYLLEKEGFGPIGPKEMKIIGKSPKSLRKKLQLPDSAPEIFDWK